MISINDRKYKDFVVEDLFQEVYNSKAYHKTNLRMTKNGIAYISRTNLDNGLEATVINEGYRLNPKNSIVFGAENATFFYEPFEFITGNKMYVIVDERIDKYNGLFVQNMLNASIKNCGFGYGKGLIGARMKKRSIRLPVNEDGEPDWEFMSDYMKMHEKKLINRYEKYLNKLKIATKQTIPEPKQWLEFRIGDLFGLVQGKSKGLNHLQEASKGVNYLGATNQNNGVLTSVLPIDKQIQKGNAIAFIRNGEGSMGYAVYKAEDFIATSDITLGYNENLNRYVGQYIVSVANKVRGKYNFGYKRSGARLVKETLLLPATENGEPDWVYMEAYERERERVNASHKELAQKVAWREYYIKDIFDISAGKRLTKADMRCGQRPFIGAADNNNGITAYVLNDNVSRDENVLGVNYNGSVVENFYHPYECIFSDDVKRFSLKNYNGNKWVYLFLKAIILKQKEKYQYGYKFNERRMHEQKILLPAQPDGDPDYGFMENYAKNLEEKQLSRYMTYLRTV